MEVDLRDLLGLDLSDHDLLHRDLSGVHEVIDHVLVKQVICFAVQVKFC